MIQQHVPGTYIWTFQTGIWKALQSVRHSEDGPRLLSAESNAQLSQMLLPCGTVYHKVIQVGCCKSI